MSDSPDRKPESSSQRDTPYFTNKTLSRRASKILVIACIVLILAVSIGGALMLIDMAQTAQDDGQTVPSDTLGQPVPDPGSPSNEM